MRGWLCLALCLLAQATQAPATQAPTKAPTPQSDDFAVPTLPISKAGAKYPDCRAELIFVIDVSGSVNRANQKTLLRFTVKFMIEIEKNIAEAKFGVVIFGISGEGSGFPNFQGDPPASKWFNRSEFGEPNFQSFNGPYGDGNSTSSELLLSLAKLQKNCTECALAGRPTWSQLDFMYSIVYNGALTPTWSGLAFAKENYLQRGDPMVPGRFIVLLTDGVPNDGSCVTPVQEPYQTPCVRPINLTDTAVIETKNGTLLLTVGMELENSTKRLMTQWASEPKDVLAVPSAQYSKLGELIDKILPIMCPAGKSVDCLAEDATFIDIEGRFLNTTTLKCRFFRDGESPTPAHTTKAQLIVTVTSKNTTDPTTNITVTKNETKTALRCPIPTENWFPGEWNLEYTQDGRGYYKGARFKTGTLCRPELLVIWWPFCALALLPLAFCRPKKVAPVTATKTSRGVARAAPAATEEYEEYEEVEEIVAPPEPVNKWKVAPTAYIGFGRARMSVDWAGVAPESAPHEGVRKKVVKKVVNSQGQPVPTAGPVPTPAPVADAPQETVSHSKPQTVEEPDWVNSCLDRVAAIFCFCCVGKK